MGTKPSPRRVTRTMYVVKKWYGQGRKSTLDRVYTKTEAEAIIAKDKAAMKRGGNAMRGWHWAIETD